MSDLAFISLFCVVYTIRLTYDINYLYKECLATNYLAIISVSILHSLTLSFTLSAWLGSNKVFIFSIILNIFIRLGWLLFNNQCILSILANKICKQEIEYGNYWLLIIQNVVVVLYGIRILYSLLNLFYKTV